MGLLCQSGQGDAKRDRQCWLGTRYPVESGPMANSDEQRRRELQRRLAWGLGRYLFAASLGFLALVIMLALVMLAMAIMG